MVLLNLKRLFIDVICENMKNYRSTAEQFFSTFHGKTRSCDRFLHILRFLHFIFKTMTVFLTIMILHYHSLRKLRHIFDLMNNAYLKCYAPSEHVGVDKVTVCFSGKSFRNKKHECLAIKMYK
jgi:hypothetical protein